MHLITLIPFVLLLIATLHSTRVQATCCYQLVGGYCKDDTKATPCCGYGKCNGFCCACGGATVLTQWYRTYDLAGRVDATTTITLPPGSTATCREMRVHKRTISYGSDGMAAKNDLPMTDALMDDGADPATTVAPADAMVTPPFWHVHGGNRPAHAQSPAECDDILMKVSHGTGEVTLEQYLDYFGFATVDDHGDDSSRKTAVINMFHYRDGDENGILTKDEIEMMVDAEDIQSSLSKIQSRIRRASRH